MNMQIKNQKGFTVVVGLLAVIAIALVVLTSFYVYNSNKDTKPAKSSEQTNEQQKPIQSSNTEEQKYFEFKELAIKIKLSPELEGLKYREYDNREKGSIIYYGATTEALNKKVQACSQGRGAGDNILPVLLFSKSNGKFAEGVYYAPEAPSSLLKQFPDSFIHTMGDANFGRQVCTDSNGRSVANLEVERSFEAVARALVDALKSAEPIQ